MIGRKKVKETLKVHFLVARHFTLDIIVFVFSPSILMSVYKITTLFIAVIFFLILKAQFCLVLSRIYSFSVQVCSSLLIFADFDTVKTIWKY